MCCLATATWAAFRAQSSGWHAHGTTQPAPSEGLAARDFAATRAPLAAFCVARRRQLCHVRSEQKRALLRGIRTRIDALGSRKQRSERTHSCPQDPTHLLGHAQRRARVALDALREQAQMDIQMGIQRDASSSASAARHGAARSSRFGCSAVCFHNPNEDAQQTRDVHRIARRGNRSGTARPPRCLPSCALLAAFPPRQPGPKEKGKSLKKKRRRERWKWRRR